MNPSAKEFVPAHILKKRQDEEAKRLGELTEQLDKVDLSTNNKDVESKENGNSCSNVGGDQKEEQATKDVQVENSSNNKNHCNSKSKPTSQNENETDNNHSKEGIETKSNNQHHHHNNSHENEYPDGLQEFIEQDEDDRYLLNAGENLCEFNGEQFIIPGDDEFDRPINAGYDFGNAEDNEDEDVCNAFEEFLDTLPDQ